MISEHQSYNDKRPNSPREHANWFSILTFWYTLKIFQMGRQANFNESDLSKPLPEHKSCFLGNKIALLWSNEVDRSNRYNEFPSMLRVLMKCFLLEYLAYGTAAVVLEFIRSLQPIFLGLLLRYFDQANNKNKNPCHHPLYLWRVYNYWTPNQCAISKSEAAIFAGGVSLCSLLGVFILHPYMMGIMHLGMKVRIACCSLIYRKILRISLSSIGGKTVGNVINLLSTDVNRFDVALVFFHYIWLGPLQVTAITFIMYREIQVSAFVGISAVVAMVPLQVWLAYRTSINRHKTALLTDGRIRLMNEIIQGIQVIKMYAWELPFCKLIEESRKNEIKYLRKTAYIKGVIMSFIMFTSQLGIFLSVLSYVLIFENQITAEKVFFVTGFFQILRQNMGVFFPQGITQLAESYVAIKRIGLFMLTKETNIGDPTPIDPLWKSRLNEKLYKKTKEMKSEQRLMSRGITIQNAWANYGKLICLEDITLDIVPGQLTVCIGQVGAGKTCLLNLILGELKPYDGTIQTNGVMSYASQEAWLFAGSVKQNILFGQVFDPKRYKEVIRVCSLEHDFSLLPHGENTIIGERGISLSGGQRARVNLARAIYKMADIYLLDDPLSAVDPQVGKHLFEECIVNYLRDKVVVLVTHQLQFLKRVKQIVIIDQGRILLKGSYTTLQKSGLDFAKLLNEPTAEDFDEELAEPGSKVQNILNKISTASTSNAAVQTDKSLIIEDTIEMRSFGNIKLNVYKKYFSSGGNSFSIFIMLSLYVLAQFCLSGSDYFLTQWVQKEEDKLNLYGKSPFIEKLNQMQCIIIFSIMIGVSIIITLIRSFNFFAFCMRSSKNLHNKMFASIIRANMRFFNTNASGRILNRFSKDLGTVDELLPNAMIDTLQIMLNLCGVVTVIIIINYTLSIPTFIMCSLFIALRQYYLHSSRNFKRLEGITKSPVYTHTTATLQGLSTIRSTEQEMILVEEFDKCQDINSSAWFMFLSTSRAFGYWMDCMCAIYISIVTMFFLFVSDKTFSGKIGLAITQSIGLTCLFQWGIRQSAELENQMTSVERIVEFINVEPEGDLESKPEKKPPVNWPSRGEIQFRNIFMFYNTVNPPILKNLNITVHHKEKIGLVGRTGAGKSSIIAAMFRLAFIKGEIIIDHIKTSKIGLHDLRKKVSIIPQEPVLFSGSLRYNLDPFNEYDDFALLKALRAVEIKLAFTEGMSCLNQIISEGGTNFSTGEKQLICLARAIVRNNKILIMDEATANVDPKTDRLIQETIRSRFEECTVLTVAHRLQTIMDCDKILVMDAGCAVEYDHPANLLQHKDGVFTNLVNATGVRTAEKLRKIAEEAYRKKYSNQAEANIVSKAEDKSLSNE